MSWACFNCGLRLEISDLKTKKKNGAREASRSHMRRLFLLIFRTGRLEPITHANADNIGIDVY